MEQSAEPLTPTSGLASFFLHYHQIPDAEALLPIYQIFNVSTKTNGIIICSQDSQWYTQTTIHLRFPCQRNWS